MADPSYLRLKADMHLHSNEDPVDWRVIHYSSFDLVEHLAAMDYNVFSITLHERMMEQERLERVSRFAKERGLVFFDRGIEKTIEGNHILVYGMRRELIESIETYRDLERSIYEHGKTDSYDGLLVMASHPFFPDKSAISERIHQKHQLLHALEHSAFFTGLVDFNGKGKEMARQYNKFMMGNSDAHSLSQIGSTYSEIKVPKAALSLEERFTMEDAEDFKRMVKNCSPEQYNQLKGIVMRYIKAGDIDVITNPIGHFDFVRRLFKIAMTKLRARRSY